MIVHLTRFVFVTAGALGGFAISGLLDWSDQIGFPTYLVILIFVILGTAIGYVLGGIIGRELEIQFSRVEARLSDLSPADLLLGTVGLIVGLLVGWLASLPLRLVSPQWLAVLSTVLAYLFAAYFGVRIALLKSGDVARAIPSLASSGSKEDRQPNMARTLKLLDTSVIIDGRFADLQAAGGLDGDLRVPRFVLAELQTLADSADDIKRARGRRGLDLLMRLQNAEDSPQVFETDYPDIPDTDDKLMKLASDMDAALITVDYNLSKVASVRGIAAVNLNEIANALRPAFLPGESLRLRIVKEGKEHDQGVGYLEDGTMVVVQDGRDHVGDEADTEVTSVLQTSAGRMIFARYVASAHNDGAEEPGADELTVDSSARTDS